MRKHRNELLAQIGEFSFRCDDPVEEAIHYYAGPRCPDYEPECPCCRAWRAFDKLQSDARTFHDEQ